jgi:hypothetical protein
MEGSTRAEHCEGGDLEDQRVGRYIPYRFHIHKKIDNFAQYWRPGFRGEDFALLLPRATLVGHPLGEE